MKRKTFLTRSALGILGGFAASRLSANDLIANQLENATYDSLASRMGFNHIPNKSSFVMKNMVIHRANTRGHANHGWLDTNHTFSFANYHHPERMHFGVLRVLNDDSVEAGMGFGTHPHNNMEIISIPLEGDLEHKDSMGNQGVIKQGDVQAMSAGTGIQHSEYNKNKDRAVKFLQIWLFPNKKAVEPRYDQLNFEATNKRNELQQILSPYPEDEGVWIHQDAWFSLGRYDAGKQIDYTVKKKGNGVYAFIIEGDVIIGEHELARRDGFGIWDADSLQMTVKRKCEILIMEVPMQIG